MLKKLVFFDWLQRSYTLLDISKCCKELEIEEYAFEKSLIPFVGHWSIF